jgi:hypothetical protein
MNANQTLDDIETLSLAQNIMAEYRAKHEQNDNQNHVTNFAQAEKQLGWVIDQLKLNHFDETYGRCEDAQ